MPAPPSFRPLPLITWGALPPGEQRAIVPELTQDLRHQIVRIRFDWARRAVIGSTTLRIAATSAGSGLSEITLQFNLGRDIDAVPQHVAGSRTVEAG